MYRKAEDESLLNCLQKRVVTTVEGVLQRTIDGLMQDQPVRKHMAPEDAKKIEEYVARIEDLLEANSTFHVVGKFTNK